jgi:16S rRNA (guanine527-N7)-methyltransferase
MPVFLTWLKDKFKVEQKNEFPNGILYLKGGDLAEEMKPVQQSVTYFDIPDLFQEEFFETKKVVYVKMKARK